MARLSKHGEEIGRVEYIDHVRAYFKTGDILINRGFGWKVYGKIKPEIDPINTYNKAIAIQNQHNSSYPNARKFVEETKNTFRKLANRNLFYQHLKMMPNDPDGLWATCNDDYKLDVTYDEILNLVTLYNRVERKI